MADDHNPLPGAHLGGNHYPTRLILRTNTGHTSEHGLDRASKKQKKQKQKTTTTTTTTTITSQMTTNSLRSGKLYFGEYILGLSHKEVSTHYIRSGFAMELYLAKVYPETIMIMGRWASSTFLRYIHIQVSDLSKGISTLMTNNRDFYTIP